MNVTFSLSLPKLSRQRMSRWLLALVVCWQAMIGFMPVAQAKAAAGEGGWESVCTMQGSSQVWVAGEVDADTDTQAKSGGHCPLCLMSQTGIAPPMNFDFKVHQSAGAEVGQLAFTAVYLTRAWSEPATGPPAQI
ncbi:MAG: hypothetical protein RL651_1515 [Pseudomonadota bacterium]|jgi:hypothetical protein